MNTVTLNQAYLFMIFMLNGLLIGIIFDIFRILRRSFQTSNLITYIEDILFWTISSLTIMYTLFVFNNGEIRGYIFIGLFLGIALYMLFLSKTIVKISVKIILFIKKIFLGILNIIAYPLKIALNSAKNALKIPSNLFNNMSNKLKKRN